MDSKNPAQAETQPEVELVTSENVKESPLIEVDAQTGKATEKERPAFDGEALEKKLSSRLNYELRQIQKAQKELMDQISRSIQPPARAERGTGEDDFETEVERVAQTDWKKAVDLRAERLAEKIAEKKLKEFQETQKAEMERQRVMDTYQQIEARSKQRVLSEFPDLADDNSDSFKNYMQIYNRELMEDPSFLQNPRKYEVVASEFRAKHQSTRSSNPEVERLKRVAAGSASSGRNVQSGSNKIMLTQEEIDLCEGANIPLATYARNKEIMAKGGFKEGVEIK